MVSSFQGEATSFQHLSHPSDLRIAFLYCLSCGEVEGRSGWVVLIHREGFLKVDPPTQVVRNLQVLFLGLPGESISIEVSTRHEDELAAEDAF